MIIIHGTYNGVYCCYRNTHKLIPFIPTKFLSLIEEKYDKFILDLDDIEFTIGAEWNISAIAIVHPKDHFNRKIGCSIVKGRIRAYKEGRYNEELPDWIYIEEEA